MRNLCEIFKQFKGQPVEIITEHNRYCGIDVDSNDTGVYLLDKCNRMILIEYRQIEAVVEPMMALKPLCKRIDCDCDYDNCDGNVNGNGTGNGNGGYERCYCD